MQIKGVWRGGVRYVHRSLERIIEDIGTFIESRRSAGAHRLRHRQPGRGLLRRPVREAVAHLQGRRVHAAARAPQQLAALLVPRHRQGRGQPRRAVHERLRPARPEHQRALRHPLVHRERVGQDARGQAVPVQDARRLHLRHGPDALGRPDDLVRHPDLGVRSGDRERLRRRDDLHAAARLGGTDGHSSGRSTSTPTTGCRS